MSEVPYDGWVLAGCFLDVVHFVFEVVLSLLFSPGVRWGVALCFPTVVDGGVMIVVRRHSALLWYAGL